MIYNVFNKEIEIDEKNKGINFYLTEMCEGIDEVCITYRYRLRRMMIDENGLVELPVGKHTFDTFQKC